MGEIKVDPDGVARAGEALAAAARRLSDAHAGLARAAAGAAMAGEPAAGAYARMHAAWLAELDAMARRFAQLASATGAAASAYVEADATAITPAAEG